jgi:hypothetical protein
MEALPSYEVSVLTRAARRNIPEDCILHIETCSLSHAGFSLDHFSALKMKVPCFLDATNVFEGVIFRKITAPHNSCCENFKSDTMPVMINI